MQTDLIELNFLSSFALVSFFVFLITQKYSNKFKNGILIDKDFNKPQSFHKDYVSRSGGIAAIIALWIFLFFNNVLFDILYIEYLLIGSSIFFLGLMDDLKIKIKPSYRLLIMILTLTVFINYLSISIEKVDLIFLDLWLNNKFFSIFFVVLCFLFIINGSNLIDGFNGLLGINLLIINLIIFYLSLNGGNANFSIFLGAQIIIILSFLFFNFPKAKIFLGDSGSYLLGTLTTINIIKINNMMPEVSSFYFCILLFYLFFEVFFSFFRKIYQKKSPINPDNLHLHMLTFKKINEKRSFTSSNYINSILINLMFSVLILPATFFRVNATVCKTWFIVLIFIYLFIYYYLSSSNYKKK